MYMFIQWFCLDNGRYSGTVCTCLYSGSVLITAGTVCTCLYSGSVLITADTQVLCVHVCTVVLS